MNQGESKSTEVKPESEDMTPVVDFGDDNDIVETLSNYFGYEKSAIEAHSRKHELVRVRDLIVFLLRKYGDLSYPAIGKLLGGRDHTTIIHSYRKTTSEIEKHPDLESKLVNIIQKVEEIKERKLRIKNELIPGIITSAKSEVGVLPRIPIFKEIPERNMKILELWREGLTLANIGNIVGVTRERVRQVVVSTVRQIAINESVTKGIVMDSNILAEEESKKRKKVQDEKRLVSKPKKAIREKRWSQYYSSCRSCGTTKTPHVRKGFCEQCIGQYRGNLREEIIDQHSNKCDSCGSSRYETNALYGRDFYITKDRSVLCKKCFSKYSGQKLGGYKNYVWSRNYEKCLECGTVSIPHAKKGLCENCTKIFTPEQREEIILAHGRKCDKCKLDRKDATSKYGRDLYALRDGGVLCKKCFQEINLKIARARMKVKMA